MITDTHHITLDLIRQQKIAILGYGNQGRAQALNLRESGLLVQVGVREGASKSLAEQDGFLTVGFEEAVAGNKLVMFLAPDDVIPGLYKALAPLLREKPKYIGFSHGFCYHFGLIERFSNCSYFLVTPKGAGTLLREAYQQGKALPGAFAIGDNEKPDTRQLVLSYAKAIGVADLKLLETTFQEETEADLFGEQVVLCGGLMELMHRAFDTLVQNGISAEMAFFECCYEAKLIMDLWLKYGPNKMQTKISPTACYGGLTRGTRIITSETKKEMQTIFEEIRSGKFTQEWLKASQSNTWARQSATKLLEETFSALRNCSEQNKLNVIASEIKQA